MAQSVTASWDAGISFQMAWDFSYLCNWLTNSHPGSQQMLVNIFMSLLSMWEIWMEFQAHNFSLAQSQFRYLRSEIMYQKSLSAINKIDT